MSDNQAMADLSRQFAGLQAVVDGIAKTLSSVAEDSREARDIAIVLKATVEGQNIPQRLDALKEQAAKDKAATEQAFIALRSDLVNAISREKADQKEINEDFEKRLKSLEDDRTERRGAGKIITWVSKNAPWLSGLVAGLMGVLIGERMSGG